MNLVSFLQKYLKNSLKYNFERENIVTWSIKQPALNYSRCEEVGTHSWNLWKEFSLYSPLFWSSYLSQYKQSSDLYHALEHWVIFRALLNVILFLYLFYKICVLKFGTLIIYNERKLNNLFTTHIAKGRFIWKLENFSN